VKTALGKSLTGPGAQTADLVAEVAAMREALEQLAPTAPRNGRVASLLRARGIEGRTAMAITRALKNAPDEGLPERMRSFLAATITVTPWPLPARGDRVLVAAVGQSGVGKTTTLAKLATLARAAGSTVTLVSCDTLRVGGTEHLRRYATLLDVAFEVARSPEELEEVIQGARTDIVFVDTSGRAPRAGSAEMALAEERFAEREACGTLQRHVLLCTPAASREIDVVSSMKSFATTAPTAIALTKLDETALPSGIIHAAMVTKLPVASVCAGPRVPEDIEAADVQRLVELVMHASESRRARAA
jgi:flagellar biosynthesis protein FlhF